MEKSPSDLDEDLRKELECPVCFEFMKPPISICENGHSICSDCKPKLKNCPSCRKPFLPVRNLALESLSTMFLNTNSIPKHSESAVTKYKCPFSTISHEDCVWNGSLQDMKHHMKTVHNNGSDTHRSKGRFTIVLTNLSPERHYRKVVWVGDELFYIVWEVKNGSFYCAVLYVGPKKKASNFTYKFSLTTENGMKNISMLFQTQSVVKEMQHFFTPGCCVLLHYDTVLKFMNSQEFLHCAFEITPNEAASLGDKNQSKRAASNHVTCDPDCPSDESELLEKEVRRELLASCENISEFSDPHHSDTQRNGRERRRGRGTGRGRFIRAGKRGVADRSLESQGYYEPGVHDFRQRAKSLGRYSNLGRSLKDLRDIDQYEVQDKETRMLGKLSGISPGDKLKFNSSSNLSAGKDKKVERLVSVTGTAIPQGKFEANNYGGKSCGSPTARGASREHITNVSAMGKKQGNSQEIIPIVISVPSLKSVKPSSSEQVSTPETTEDKSRINHSKAKSPSSEQVTHVTALGKPKGNFQTNSAIVKSGFSTISSKNPTTVPKPHDKTEALCPKIDSVAVDDFQITDVSPFDTVHDLVQANASKDKAPNNVSLGIDTSSQQSTNVSPDRPFRSSQPHTVSASGETWKCPMCGHTLPAKPINNNFRRVDIAPLGTKWKCKLCGQWRP
jgi:E3 ubiquitin-protein ligase SIAH1